MKTDIRLTGLTFARLLLMKELIKSLMRLCMVAGIFLLPQVYAQSLYYISPRLQLGVHTQSSLDSPIKELISSGSVVEVLKTEKEFTQIKTEKGTTGWIKNKFLTQEEPAMLKVKALEQSLIEVQEQLLDEQNRNKNTGEGVENNVSEDTISEDKSQARMAAYEETIAGLKAEIKAWEQLDSQDKQAHKEQANQVNQLLLERLAKIATLAAGQETDAGAASIPLPAITQSLEIDDLEKKGYLFYLMIGGTCFILGIFLMDLLNRRRHGGYRV